MAATKINLRGSMAELIRLLRQDHGNLAALTRHCLEAIREVRFGGGMSRARVGGRI